MSIGVWSARVSLPSTVSAAVKGQVVKMKGPKGEVSFAVPEEIAIVSNATEICLESRSHAKKVRSTLEIAHTMVVNLIKSVAGEADSPTSRLLRAAERLKTANTASPEIAREKLVELGILSTTGGLSKNYK